MTFRKEGPGTQPATTTFQEVPEVWVVLTKRKMGLSGESEKNGEQWEVETEQPLGSVCVGFSRVIRGL